MRLFITGINGFIGTHLLEAILTSTDWEVCGFDIVSANLASYIKNPRFSFLCGDIFKDDDVIAQEIFKADIIIPLAGIAKPAYYLKKPVWTFSLDFEQNLKIVRFCSAYGRRIIFPSTSEVYGMSTGEELEEDESVLITGPIAKTRWIYSCSKQMMDRMIFAYAQEQGLQFTIFRPFNWIGPRLDTFNDAQQSCARSVTQMFYDIIHRRKVFLVNGGEQRRSFTWIGDGIEGLMAIIKNEEKRADGEIFNIGNPANNASIREVAELLIEEAKNFPQFREVAQNTDFESISSDLYYGRSYEDMQNRRPSIKKMEHLLDWRPKTGIQEALRRTIAWYAENGENR